MISFVWSADYPFIAGAGGSESYTAGQIRELQRRGIPCRILTLGFGENDGREGFPDISFKALKNKEELSELDDTLVFVTYPLAVKTKHQSYVILHCPPPLPGTHEPLCIDPEGIVGKKIIAPSRYAAKLWARYFGRTTANVAISHPFAEDVYSIIKRPENKTGKQRILFAGRLTPEKGIYTLLAALHMDGLRDSEFELSVVGAGAHTPDGQLLVPLLQAHPKIHYIPAQTNPRDMARVVADHDILVMPSTEIFWKEMFGILSVEAQHAGLRVVASRAGGLPETNCGGMLFVRPDNPAALAGGMRKAISLGPLSESQRRAAQHYFTVEQSVDQLLRAIRPAGDRRTELLREPGARLQQLYPQLALFAARSK